VFNRVYETGSPKALAWVAHNCYDPDKTILRVCDIHRERYTEMVEAGEVLTVENMEKGRGKR